MDKSSATIRRPERVGIRLRVNNSAHHYQSPAIDKVAQRLFHFFCANLFDFSGFLDLYSSMLSYEYHKRVKEYANQHSVSIERARSELGKKGAETRKKNEERKREIEAREFWWNKD